MLVVVVNACQAGFFVASGAACFFPSRRLHILDRSPQAQRPARLEHAPTLLLQEEAKACKAAERKAKELAGQLEELQRAKEHAEGLERVLSRWAGGKEGRWGGKLGTWGLCW